MKLFLLTIISFVVLNSQMGHAETSGDVQVTSSFSAVGGGFREYFYIGANHYYSTYPNRFYGFIRDSRGWYNYTIAQSLLDEAVGRKRPVLKSTCENKRLNGRRGVWTPVDGGSLGVVGSNCSNGWCLLHSGQPTQWLYAGYCRW